MNFSTGTLLSRCKADKWLPQGPWEAGVEGWQGRVIKEGDEIFGGVMGAFMITTVGMVLRQYSWL